MLKKLTEFEDLCPVYNENKDTEILKTKDPWEKIRKCANMLLKEWESAKP